MITVIQRVASARVEVSTETVAAINRGLLALVGFERGDEVIQGQRLLERLLNYRVFADTAGKMNLSLTDIKGGLMLVPQFTLVADTSSGTRPGFSLAAAPEDGRRLFDDLCLRARQLAGEVHTQTGVFGADMQVHIVNDGPATFYMKF